MARQHDPVRIGQRRAMHIHLDDRLCCRIDAPKLSGCATKIKVDERRRVSDRVADIAAQLDHPLAALLRHAPGPRQAGVGDAAGLPQSPPGRPQLQAGRTLADNLRRAQAKFALMQRMGIETILVCSTVATATIDDEETPHQEDDR